jgi:plastocyanin
VVALRHGPLLGACIITLACARTPAANPVATYTPRTRELTVTTVPLLVKEGVKVYPFLQKAFAKGGVLDGKEVYAFSPSTLTVMEGDTIHFTFINPEDDLHTFVLPDLSVGLPGFSTVHATYIARRAGIFPITCSVASHLPMMSGQLIVLAPGAVGGEAPPPVPTR